MGAYGAGKTAGFLARDSQRMVCVDIRALDQ